MICVLPGLPVKPSTSSFLDLFSFSIALEDRTAGILNILVGKWYSKADTVGVEKERLGRMDRWDQPVSLFYRIRDALDSKQVKQRDASVAHAFLCQASA